MQMNSESSIRMEDKQNKKKFLILMVCVFFGSMVLGFFTAMLNDKMNLSELGHYLNKGIQYFSIYANLIMVVIATPIVNSMYKKSKKQFEVWDGEEESVYDEIDHRLTVALIIVGMIGILSFVFMAIGFLGLFDLIGSFEHLEFNRPFVIGLVCFVIGLIWQSIFTMVAQKNIVNLTKLMNPEKKGSVYDIQFSEKWMDSCDEAERMGIYQASLASFKAVSLACQILSFVCLVGMLLWDFGIVPIIMVGTIWMVSAGAYYKKGIELEKGIKN